MIGSIYVIQEAPPDGPIKIGYTKNGSNRRCASLQVGNPRELQVISTFPGTPSSELKIQRDLAEYRIRGEWFENTPFVTKYLALEEDLARKKQEVDEFKKAQEVDAMCAAILEEVSLSAKLWRHMNDESLVGWRPRGMDGGY